MDWNHIPIHFKICGCVILWITSMHGWCAPQTSQVCVGKVVDNNHMVCQFCVNFNKGYLPNHLAKCHVFGINGKPLTCTCLKWSYMPLKRFFWGTYCCKTKATLCQCNCSPLPRNKLNSPDPTTHILTSQITFMSSLKYNSYHYMITFVENRVFCESMRVNFEVMLRVSRLSDFSATQFAHDVGGTQVGGVLMGMQAQPTKMVIEWCGPPLQSMHLCVWATTLQDVVKKVPYHFAQYCAESFVCIQPCPKPV